MKNNEHINKNGSVNGHSKNAEPNLKNTSENSTAISTTTDKEDENKKRKLNKESFKYLLGIYEYMMPYKGYFFSGMFCLFLSSIVLLAFPKLTGNLVDVAGGNENFLLDSINQITLALVIVIVIQVVFESLFICSSK